jgi:hypothetical protein
MCMCACDVHVCMLHLGLAGLHMIVGGLLFIWVEGDLIQNVRGWGVGAGHAPSRLGSRRYYSCVRACCEHALLWALHA